MQNGHFVLVVSGLAFEARIAVNIEGTRTCFGQAPLILQALGASITPECCGILSFGLVGALDPKLRAGSLVVATEILGADGRFPTDVQWTQNLMQVFPQALHATIYGTDRLHADAATKHRSFGSSGAAVVDMESHVAARFAAEKNLPFAALRVVADTACRSVSQSALAGLCLDGRIDRLAVLRGVLRRPRDAFNLAALACDALLARVALMKVQRQLGGWLEGSGFAHPRAAAAVAVYDPAPADNPAMSWR